MKQIQKPALIHSGRVNHLLARGALVAPPLPSVHWAGPGHRGGDGGGRRRRRRKRREEEKEEVEEEEEVKGRRDRKHRLVLDDPPRLQLPLQITEMNDHPGGCCFHLELQDSRVSRSQTSPRSTLQTLVACRDTAPHAAGTCSPDPSFKPWFTSADRSLVQQSKAGHLAVMLPLLCGDRALDCCSARDSSFPGFSSSFMVWTQNHSRSSATRAVVRHPPRHPSASSAAARSEIHPERTYAEERTVAGDVLHIVQCISVYLTDVSCQSENRRRGIKRSEPEVTDEADTCRFSLLKYK
ncbi:unnamed protein product [Pleuronectes platessa]|uniref:Uncharacterized protein n=1 Tax=Pleuronectes platessa TaxID=8262 RepID=A0A9N7V586_PLEPL|nr:unnamed protein product [Pleuronectes platessa]